MTTQPTKPQDGAAGLILVVEDELVVALDPAATLRDGGFRILGPVTTVPAALQLLAQQRPDAAVLDVNLRNDMVTPVAHALRGMRVPFVVVSAYSKAALLNDEVLSDAPKLDKPVLPSELVDAINGLLGRADQDVRQRHGL
jgi:CheY-like chemotaxis protein